MNQDKIDWNYYHQVFPVNKKYIWLNNCGATPASGIVLDEMQRFLSAYAEEAYLAADYRQEVIKQEIQQLLAAMVHTNPENIALVHNTAEGMNMLSHGLALDAGDQILLLEGEFASNIYPWEHWRERGVEISILSLASTPRDFLKGVKRQITDRTRLIAVSAVHWCTGMPLPVREIAALCRERGILLAVDGAQGVGHVPIDVDGWQIPFLTFPFWKWLLGPQGMGCLVIPPWALARIKPLFAGPDALQENTGHLPLSARFKPTAERYMYSTPNLNDWVYARASLRILAAIGFERVQERLYELAAFLSGLLRKHGFQVLADAYTTNSESDAYRTAILVVEKPGLDTAGAVQFLNSRGVVCRERMGRIRLAPHIYLSYAQLEQAADLLGTLA